jgi:CheY-like chemotaxis protein
MCLVVDDEEDSRELLKTVFESYGATVTTVALAAAAMREVERAIPHVIVSDVGMPVEDGLSLMRRIRGTPASAGGDVEITCTRVSERATPAVAKAASRCHP